ncbi:MAG: hypothetical protein KZQ66_09520, partial [Candidatus Thiodiazotropha sp. (ex Lucinoma aequizonata)]|nr:hypothetical protein [Candidatus Thiodiazotropha sp. (ex Lucinoma aequizonata)]MCU7902203.1 hypothetical protein [Candidatus Thiodiazotropha sp. (ex Lucinoma aequizonata)]
MGLQHVHLFFVGLLLRKNTFVTHSVQRNSINTNFLGNYSAKKLEKVLDKVFLYFFRFQRRLPTY